MHVSDTQNERLQTAKERTSSSTLLMGVDVGTSVVKAGLFAVDGQMHAAYTEDTRRTIFSRLG